MIVPITNESGYSLFADIYNSAIELFQESERSMATEETFSDALKQDLKFAERQEDGTFRGFIAYHSYGNYYELTALYVKKPYQKQGTGHKLLQYVEEKIREDGVAEEIILFVKILKNAPWSLEFYKKNGYVILEPALKEIAASIGMVEKPWSAILCKRIKR